tara:strand:- start:1884 stop:2345 length:462 start_codon:yes stop_codon:yes gene_type:complete
MKEKGGILVYRINQGKLEVLLGHPGGPWNEHADEGSWSIPKGGKSEEDESLLYTARREFYEETGFSTKKGPYLNLGDSSKKGKLLHVWACQEEFDLSKFKSNTFKKEYPPGSGRIVETPEFDRVEYLDLDTAGSKILASQKVFLDRLAKSVKI